MIRTTVLGRLLVLLIVTHSAGAPLVTAQNGETVASLHTRDYTLNTPQSDGRDFKHDIEGFAECVAQACERRRNGDCRRLCTMGTALVADRQRSDALHSAASLALRRHRVVIERIQPFDLNSYRPINMNSDIIRGSITPHSVQEEFPRTDPRHYGADLADNSNDDASAISRALADGNQTIFLPDGIYNFKSALVINHSARIHGSRNAVIKCEPQQPTDPMNCIYIQSNEVTLEGFSIQGPTRGNAYIAGQIGVLALAPKGSTYESINLRSLHIHNFGEYGVHFNRTIKSEIVDNTINDIGYAAVMVLAGRYVKVNHNYVENVQPGRSTGQNTVNAYGIAFSRSDPDDSVSLWCEARGNTINSVPSWECLDTHGGQYITFTDNMCRGCKTGINLTSSDLGTSNVSASYVTISGNTLYGTGAGPCLNLWPKGNGSNGNSINVLGNVLVNCGSSSSATDAALFARDISGLNISGNQIVASYYKAILLGGQVIGGSIAGNHINNVTAVGSVNTALRVVGNQVQVTIDGNSFYRSSGSAFDAFDFASPLPGYGVTLGDNNSFFNVNSIYFGRSKQNVVGGCHKHY
ncbi:MAG TPA: hypothetical protein VFV34_23565 [Blastocatellia bacterium]|nr:hypothetical protein [Blastocatellia bacterium]